MEGLEASIVSKMSAMASASTRRLDPEYFRKQYLLDQQSISERASQFVTCADLSISVDASAFYPSIEEYYETGDLPFYRVGDVDGMIDSERALRIPAELCDRFPTLKMVSPGDILLTKGGAIDRTGYVRAIGAVSRDLIFLDTSRLPEPRRLSLFAFFGTELFRRLLTRSSSQTAQPHLTITLVRDLPMFLGSDQLCNRVASLINSAYRRADEAGRQIESAEDCLLKALGLADWTPPEPLSFTAHASDAFAAGRWDAQYFRPLFAEVEQRLLATGGAVKLGAILDINSRGRQPDYSDEGLPVINSKHVRTNKVLLDDDNRRAVEAGAPVVIEKGDVLVNGTGVGTIGRAAAFLHEQNALPDNHVTVLRTSRVDPIYLAVFLNSLLGQLQIERHIKGSSGQIELYPNDIAKIVFWDAPDHVQIDVRDAVLSAFNQERRAQDLLEAAKRAVEIAIDDGEPAALAFLDAAEGTS
ncbi:hypothetical protein [Rhodovulum bhavnagarense]|nr:hypothetical protein [Rhodovulum bhavnagarense]